jgi:hypothetical protein
MNIVCSIFANLFNPEISIILTKDNFLNPR